MSPQKHQKTLFCALLMPDFASLEGSAGGGYMKVAFGGSRLRSGSRQSLLWLSMGAICQKRTAPCGPAGRENVIVPASGEKRNCKKHQNSGNEAKNLLKTKEITFS
jgi:hypothetical protein